MSAAERDSLPPPVGAIVDAYLNLWLSVAEQHKAA